MDSDKIKIDLSKGLSENNAPYSFYDLLDIKKDELSSGNVSKETIAQLILAARDFIPTYESRFGYALETIYYSMMVLKYIDTKRTIDSEYASNILNNIIYLKNDWNLTLHGDYYDMNKISKKVYSKVRNMIVPFVDDIEIPESIDDNEEFKFENALNVELQIENFKKWYPDGLNFLKIMTEDFWRLF